MAKITSIRITEQFEHFLKDLKESLWGDLYGQTRLAWKKFWEIQSVRERDSYMKTGWYEQVEPNQRAEYRNGFYERDYVTRLGTIRLRIARTRGRNFLPQGLEKFQRRPKTWQFSFGRRFCVAFPRARWEEWWRQSRARR